MPALVAWIGTMLIGIAGSWVLQALVAVGVGILTYTGVDTSLTYLKTQALQAMSGGAASIVPLLSYMKVGVCINIIFSATVTRMTLAGLTGGTLKRWFIK